LEVNPLLKFKSIGKDVLMFPLTKIIYPEQVSIGDCTIIDDFVFMMVKATIGSFVHIACMSSIVGNGEFVMGDFSSVSHGCRVFTGNEDWHGNAINNPTVEAPYRKSVLSFVRLEKHATLGANSVILPGVTLHEGALVGACSLVKTDCDPYSVYVGSPAKKVKEYSNEKLVEIERLLRKDYYDSQGNYIEKALRGVPKPGGQTSILGVG
jgi:acetyltransferase-like isoleucine patch superfamily enzyme